MPSKKASTMLLSILIGVVLLYFALCALLYLFQERFIFFPTRLTSKEIEFIEKLYPGTKFQIETPDKTTLHGWLVKSSHPKEDPLILYYGGNAEEVSANLFEGAKIPNASVLFLSYRGYGLSGGKPSQEALFRDALFVLDQMIQKEGFDPKRIFLMGRSLGSGVAIHVASKREVKGLILITPFDSLAKVGQRAYRIFPVTYLLRHPFNSLPLAKKIDRPLLAIIAENDSVIPKENSLNLFENWKGEKKLITIPEADHNDLHLDPDYWEEINKFLTEQRE